MKRILITFCFTTALHAQQPAAAPHTFTSADGRKLTATIIEKTATTVTLRRAEDGKDFILQIDRLSSPDQSLVKAWGKKPVPLVMADPALPESWVVPPKYEYLEDWEFTRGAWSAGPMYETFGGNENRRGLIRSDGVILCDPDKDEGVPPSFFDKDGVQEYQVMASYFKDHRAFPKLSGGRWGLVDLDGRQVVPPQWDSVGTFSEGLFDFTVAGKVGYATLKGEVVIQPLWTYAESFSGGYAIVRAIKGGKPSVIDKTGKIISDAVWDQVKQLRLYRDVPIPRHVSVSDFRPAEFPPGVFWVKKNKKWGLYDIAKNVPMGEVQWDYPSDFVDGKAWVRRPGKGKYGMIDPTGKVVLEPVWDGILYNDGHYASPVRAGNCIESTKDGKTAWWHLDGTPALADDVSGDSLQHCNEYYQIKIKSGKLVRVAKFRIQEPTRMLLRRREVDRMQQGPIVGLADLDGNLLGKVEGIFFITATPSPDYFKVSFRHSGAGLIDASGKEVEPISEAESISLDTIEIGDAKSLPDGEIVAAFRGTSNTATPDTLFIKTANGLVKVPWQAPDTTDAPSTVTVKAHEKDGKWGYIRLIEAKP